MKLFKLIKLGHKNITHHKKQTIFTVIIIGSLFSILMALQFLVQGIENIVIKEYNQTLAEKTYIVARNSNSGDMEDAHNKASAKCHDNIPEEPLETYNIRYMKCLNNSNYEEETFAKDQDINKINQIFSNRSKPYNGKIAGNIQFINYQPIVPIELFKKLITADLSKKPIDALPVIMNFEGAAKLIDQRISKKASNQEKLDLIKKVRVETIGKTFDINEKKIYIAGIMPYGKDSVKIAKADTEFKLLDIILENIISPSDFSFIYLNDNSQIVKDFMTKFNFTYYATILEFEKLEDAYKYYQYENHIVDPNIWSNNDYKKAKHTISELLTNKIQTVYKFKLFKFMISFANYVLLVVAVIVIVFTFLKLINQDSKLMALYRSLGATGFDVFLIYFWYILELCLLAIVYSFVVAGTLVLIISNHYSADFNSEISLFFGRILTDFKIFIGFNQELVQIVMVILLSAPLVSILTIDQLSMKNTAKRLKRQ